MNNDVKIVRPVDVARRMRSESNEALYSWVRLIITLSSTFLSVLIAFKSNYVPDNPNLIQLLLLSLIGFVTTIFSGIIILHSEVQTKFDSANHIDSVIENKGEQAAVDDINKRGGKTYVRTIYIWAHYIFHISFALAFVFLVAFIVSNKNA